LPTFVLSSGLDRADVTAVRLSKATGDLNTDQRATARRTRQEIHAMNVGGVLLIGRRLRLRHPR
jgi:hypothetical protein